MDQMRVMTHCKVSSRIRRGGVVLVLALVALAGPSLARSPQERVWRKACTADAFSLCPLQAITGNRNGVRDCLLKKLDKVSDTCVAVIRAAQQPELTASTSPLAR